MAPLLEDLLDPTLPGALAGRGKRGSRPASGGGADGNAIAPGSQTV